MCARASTCGDCLDPVLGLHAWLNQKGAVFAPILRQERKNPGMGEKISVASVKDKVAA